MVEAGVIQLLVEAFQKRIEIFKQDSEADLNLQSIRACVGLLTNICCVSMIAKAAAVSGNCVEHCILLLDALVQLTGNSEKQTNELVGQLCWVIQCLCWADPAACARAVHSRGIEALRMVIQKSSIDHRKRGLKTPDAGRVALWAIVGTTQAFREAGEVDAKLIREVLEVGITAGKEASMIGLSVCYAIRKLSEVAWWRQQLGDERCIPMLGRWLQANLPLDVHVAVLNAMDALAFCSLQNKASVAAEANQILGCIQPGRPPLLILSGLRLLRTIVTENEHKRTVQTLNTSQTLEPLLSHPDQPVAQAAATLNQELLGERVAVDRNIQFGRGNPIEIPE
eukprot:c12960_g1_i3.p1 GENE.c12960_g1_i3~~c12960_g1_i3.p1  ORF type:complete len:339 (+),score=77.74 c12960_g1_i3:53-1069(+)